MPKQKKSPGRVTASDISHSIYSPDDTRGVSLTPYQQRETQDKEQIVYTIVGKQHDYDNDGNPLLYDVQYEDGQIDHAEDSVDALAKESSFKGQRAYYLKVGYGGQIYNPNGLYEGAGRSPNSKRLGRNEYNWTKVNRRAFLFYLEFLRTKNSRFITNAQREVM